FILARRDAFFVTMVEPFLNHTHSVWFSFHKKNDGTGAPSRDLFNQDTHLDMNLLFLTYVWQMNMRQ
ncbi:hypothetical protein U525_02557, partial [Staphylococcus aureus F77917]